MNINTCVKRGLISIYFPLKKKKIFELKLIKTIYRHLYFNFVFVFLLYDTQTQTSRYIMNIFEFRTTSRSCVAILHFEEADLDRKRRDVSCRRIASREASFS